MRTSLPLTRVGGTCAKHFTHCGLCTLLIASRAVPADGLKAAISGIPRGPQSLLEQIISELFLAHQQKHDMHRYKRPQRGHSHDLCHGAGWHNAQSL